ncbi:molybdopterin-dependent oxidoreductase [Zoogloea sp.]|uniref:molybdopterin-dependent oxidoreductase n=1 Tax=Zoogloea sp. TaxID=49181 RepID=UPI001415E2A6|nr:MAG: molybdopterin-dependent oxidoreductase [Zoogloea sp.]
MDKRRFLHTALASAALPGAALAAPGKIPAAAGPTLLTISGEVAHPNRGRLDPALDQLMSKHGVHFDKARSFTYADLAALPAVELRPTLEYDAKPHALRGPLLSRLLDIAGAGRSARATVGLRALDGYNVELSLAELRRRALIVATHIDGAPLPLGGLGPLWAVFDPAMLPELAARPLPERFAQCPWGLYSVHVVEAAG